jgi:mannose-6-phosphate isomerase-like protein (cupin superfamily)
MPRRIIRCETEALSRKNPSMSQKPVVTVGDITNIALEERRPGCDKGMLHEDAPVQTAVYRVQPGSGVPTHMHAQVYDLFVV